MTLRRVQSYVNNDFGNPVPTDFDIDVIPATSPPTACLYIEDTHVLPGWSCCQCHLYNGLQRGFCKTCGHVRCQVLQEKS